MNYLTHYTIEAAYENGNWDNISSSRECVLARLLYIIGWFFFSRMDVSTEFSFEHMLEFSKLAVGFAMELSTV